VTSLRDSRRDAASAVVRRVLLALIALPRQIVVVVRSADRSGWTRSLIGLAIALVVNVAALFLLFSLVRAIYYPFWAIGASPEELDRSWGGPSAVGATLVHWLVAAAVIVVSYAVILFAERRAPEAT
jgi:hypothetical protein